MTQSELSETMRAWSALQRTHLTPGWKPHQEELDAIRRLLEAFPHLLGLLRRTGTLPPDDQA